MGTRKRVLFHIVFWSVFFCGIFPSRVTAQGTPASVQFVAELPDSPGTTLLNSQQASAQESRLRASAPISSQSPAMQGQTMLAQESQAPSAPAEPAQARPQVVPEFESSTQKPVGTAAAGVIPVSGVAASQPAGVAIAPAKQHRVRTIVLRMGAIVGAGVAVGSVVALTEGTSGKPPGAR
jgi:hypothetical protein